VSRAQQITRADWLRRAQAIGAGVLSGGIVVGGLATRALSSPSKRQDATVLNFALAFEELQADFYARALRGRLLRGEWLKFAQVVGGHERAHVTFLRRALGAATNPAPTFELVHQPASVGEFIRVAIAIEDIGVALYNGQAANLTKTSLAAAAEIVSVEARHAAWARELAGQSPAPVAVDVPADVSAVKHRLADLGVKIG
jgi:hypothetical protein